VTGVTCTPNWDCSDWGECQVDYDIEDVLLGVSVLRGVQRRACSDGACDLFRTETRECDYRIPIKVERKFWCDEDYVFVYDLRTGELLSRVKYKEIEGHGLKRLDLIFSFDEDECPSEEVVYLYGVFDWRFWLIVVYLISIVILVTLVLKQIGKERILKGLAYLKPEIKRKEKGVSSFKRDRKMKKYSPSRGPKKAKLSHKDWLKRRLGK
jgi:hypothetical protein